MEDALQHCPGVSENVEIVRKENMKERYHYKDHRLIHDLIVMPKEGIYYGNGGGSEGRGRWGKVEGGREGGERQRENSEWSVIQQS